MVSKGIFLLFFGATFSAFAQMIEVRNSHLNCFRGNFDAPFQFKAIVDLKANQKQNQYSVRGCRVKTKKIDLCVPSTKKILQSDTTYPKIINDVQAQSLKNDFICYYLKCDPDLNLAELPVEQPAADQFGVKYFQFKNTMKFRVCVPAWKIGSDGRPIII